MKKCKRKEYCEREWKKAGKERDKDEMREKERQCRKGKKVDGKETKKRKIKGNIFKFGRY